jgi:hypothetical protein
MKRTLAAVDGSDNAMRAVDPAGAPAARYDVAQTTVSPAPCPVRVVH